MQQKEKLMHIEDPLSHIQSYYIIVAYYVLLYPFLKLSYILCYSALLYTDV